MINSIKMIKPSKDYNYLSEEEKISNLLKEGLTFKSGTNILLGKNGSGKSTIISILKEAMGISHAFVPEKKKFPFQINDYAEFMNCFEIKADYKKPSFGYFNMLADTEAMTNNAIVLGSGDNLLQYLSTQRRSKGQNTFGDLVKASIVLYDNRENKSVYSLYDDNEKLINRYNELNVEDKFYTLVGDEPDSGLDISNLNKLYNFLSDKREDIQLIFSIHNPALIYKLSKLDYINFIETTPGYLEEIKKFF